MSNYTVPGVKVEEVSTLPASVVAVETAIPAFIGMTAKHAKGVVSLKNVPTRIKSMVEFEAYYGGPKDQDITVNVDEDTNLPTSATVSSQTALTMYFSVRHFFANGGGPCYIVSTGIYTDTHNYANTKLGLDALAREDEPTLICFPDGSAFTDLFKDAMTQCETLKDRFTIIDPIRTASTNWDTNFRTPMGTANLKYGGAYYPWLETTYNHGYSPSTITFVHPSGSLDGVTLYTAADIVNEPTPTPDANLTPAFYAAMEREINKLYVTLPPSGAIAGVMATVDRTRGVWKAPANVAVNNVNKADINITDSEQGLMNVDSSGKSINAIRNFTGKGILVWGARTLAGNDNEWRYVPVRRLYNMVEESVKKATEFVVFEPNDANTWTRTKAMIENFLNTIWRQGGLAGPTPESAYYVNVGLGETMSPQDILEGRLIIEIGMAAVRPAEFIILRFSHKLQEA